MTHRITSPTPASRSGAPRLLATRRGPSLSRAGLTLVELVIASGIIAVLLLASAAAMGESVESTNMSRSLTRGAIFLESVQEDLAAMSASDLLAMNGQSVHSTDDWDDAPYRVDIVVFTAAVDLLQIELRLIDQYSGRSLASVHAMRADV